MKPISLSTKQKDLLLKLCQRFFPAYKNISYLDQVDLTVSSNSIYVMAFITNKEQYGFKARTIIPWYELCSLELPKRIFDEINPKKYDDINSVFFTNYQPDYRSIILTNMIDNPKVHIVDFLWSFVEELDKNNNFKK